MPPLALSDEMLAKVMDAAALLPVSSRDAFLKSVAGHVAGVPHPGMDTVDHAIAVVTRHLRCCRRPSSIRPTKKE
jgi:hypothetical protein